MSAHDATGGPLSIPGDRNVRPGSGAGDREYEVELTTERVKPASFAQLKPSLAAGSGQGKRRESDPRPAGAVDSRDGA